MHSNQTYKQLYKMKEKLSREELEKQIAELKYENEMLRLSPSFKREEEISEIDFLITRGKIRESSMYTASLLNNMGDSVFIKDDQSRLLFVNDSFCKMFNLPRIEIIGETLAADVTVDESENFLRIDRQVLLDGIENISEETLTVRDRETLLISKRKSRFTDSNGKNFLVGVVRDMTHSKKAEQALKESETKFRELNSTKDKLFSIIAHDLRGPFNNILSLVELLIFKAAVVEDSKEYLNMIHSTAHNTLGLLDNLLNWATCQTGQIQCKSEKINVSTVIQEIVELSHSIAKPKNISLTQIEEDIIEIWSDEKMIKTILRNLISNAIKFTRHEGSICISVTAKLNQIEITVSDNGVGINEETRCKLFGITSNISTLGTSNEKGSGFGLVLCKDFVEKLGGNIWVESEEGKGSDFKFVLPL
jgi:PAS domain S-box-containing protein